MLIGLDNYPGSINDKNTVELAIFYHDIVYNPLRQDNEHQSGVVARTLLLKKGVATLTRSQDHSFDEVQKLLPDHQARLEDRSVSELKSQKIYDYILATKSHQTGNEDDEDLHLLLDLDLAILGTDSENYREYTRQIRKEYWMFPGPVYRAGRRKAMAHFLEQPRIFKTDHYFERLEEQARQNITSELA